MTRVREIANAPALEESLSPPAAAEVRQVSAEGDGHAGVRHVAAEGNGY